MRERTHRRSQNRRKCDVTAGEVAQCDAIYCSSCVLFVRPVRTHHSLNTIVDQMTESIHSVAEAASIASFETYQLLCSQRS